MPMRLKYEVIADIGKYNDRQTGEEKKVWQKCGVIMENTDGSGKQSLKLNTIPVGPDWSGWFSIQEPREQSHGR